MIAPARVAAFDALREVTEHRLDLAPALARSRARLADARDRALAADIVVGTLRWQRRLDYLIEHVSRRPPATLDRDVLLIVRLSGYQLLHLDRVPASAVVDDAVELTKAAGRSSAASFVNAVLRTLSRTRRSLTLPERPADETDREASIRYLGVTHSHPEWLVTRWLARYGLEAAEQWVRFDNEPPLLTLRVNRLQTTRDRLRTALAAEGVETRPTRYALDGLVVTAGNPIQRSLNGRFFVQDEASQIVATIGGARPGERVLDLCASPGNKTTALAADMADTGLVVASDVRRRRLDLLRRMVERSGASCVRVVHVGERGPLPLTAIFDRVLVDAPCSGLGTIRRDPDIRWRRSEHDLPVFAAQQVALLHRAADVVKPGGRLVYSTCSSEPEENDEVVDAWLADRGEFQAIDLRLEAPPAVRPLIDDRGALRTLPFAHGLEAFFAVALQRRRVR